MANIFQNLQLQAFRAGITPRTKESRTWFANKVRGLRSARISREDLIEDDDVVIRSAPRAGSMYMYYYDPKHKDTLPFYDTFPLSIVVGPAEGGFYGLNLHYLPPILRAKMLDQLLGNITNKKYDDTTKFRANYEVLQAYSGAPYYKATLKHYLRRHVRSRYAEVQPTEWEIATFLPTATWRKRTANYVYTDSRKKIA